jgi:hypothetical protein
MPRCLLAETRIRAFRAWHALKNPISAPGYFYLFVVTVMRAQFREEMVDIKLPVSPVTATADAEGPDNALITPSPQRVGVNVHQTGHLAHGHHGSHVTGYAQIHQQVFLLSWASFAIQHST